jgi:putative nucleotidyltransferase with HDIG domain
MTDRQAALDLLREHVKSEALIRHMLAVEAALVWYARKFGEDEEKWSVTGLLHDFDYELFPEAPDHTREGAKILRERGVDEEIIGAVLSHAEWNLDDYPRDTPLRKTLFAVDELCGFIHAVALVRPSGFEGMKPSSVKKKMKSKGFAAAVSRDDIVAGAEMLGVSLDEHIAACIEALAGISAELGL